MRPSTSLSGNGRILLLCILLGAVLLFVGSRQVSFSVIRWDGSLTLMVSSSQPSLPSGMWRLHGLSLVQVSPGWNPVGTVNPTP